MWRHRSHNPSWFHRVATGVFDTMRTLLSAFAALAIALPASAEDKTIVEIAAGNKDFSTLVAAVKAAGLVDTLNGPGPFTVFAPTDEAFAKLPEGTVENLLKPENKDKLVKILTYHVIKGEVKAEKVLGMNGKKVPTVQGSDITITVSGGKVMINKANVIKTDIQACNGVIHVIDTVILPPDNN